MAPSAVLRRIALAIVASLSVCAAATAEDAALVIGNASYEDGSAVAGTADVLRAARKLKAASVDTLTVRNANSETITRQLQQFEQFTARADSLLIVLSGRFVRSDTETWFLPVETDGEALVETAAAGLPLSLMLSLLSDAPTRAILMLGADPEDRDSVGRALRAGVGRLEVPQGVTVLRAPPAEIARMMRDTIAVPGASIRQAARASEAIRMRGYMSADLAFIPGPGTVAPEGEPSQGAQTEAPGRDERAEAALWGLVTERDDEESYRAYLERYPEGRHAAEARRRIEADRRAPNRAARNIEDNLDLNRDRRRRIQRDLMLLGHDTRGIDGIFGEETRRAIKVWQRANNKAATGYLDLGQVRQIEGQAARRAAKLEEEERRRREETRRAEEKFWQETGAGRTEAGLARFLKRYPDGDFSDRAGRRLGEIRDEGVDTHGIPDDERRRWRSAREAGTRAAYRRYLEAFPDGRFAGRARQSVAEIDARRETEAGASREERADEAALGLTQTTRRAVEQRLQALEFRPGAVDGSFDDRTRRALRRYQRTADLDVSGYLDRTTLVRLLAGSLRDALR